MFSVKLWSGVLILLLLSTSCFASAQTDFKQGVEHFKKGHYKTAINFFQLARKQGLKTAALYHNLAASHFKLSHFKRAEKYFKISRRFPKMKMLAEYNLGLIALNRKQEKIALNYFKNVAATTSNKKLAAKARSRIRTITQQKKNNWSAYALLGYGYVDNISAAPEVGTATKLSDNYYSLYAHGTYALTGTLTNGIIVGAMYLDKNYEVENAYDFQIYSVVIGKTFTRGPWKSGAGIYYFESTFGNTAFQNTNRLELFSRYALSSQDSVRLRYRHNDISSRNTSYDYLAGTRQRIRAEYRHKTKTNYTKLYYEFEQNDRSETLTTINSYSPTRHTLRAAYTYTFNDKLKLKGGLAYRVSQYPSHAYTDVTNPPTLLTTAARDETRIKTRLELSYGLNKIWSLSAKYIHTDNDSDNPDYHYKRKTSFVSINASF